MTVPDTPSVLPLDHGAVRWSVSPAELDAALASRPLVVLLHGFAAHEGDLASLAHVLPATPVYASLRAPLPVSGMPGGWAWFPLMLSEDAVDGDPRLADAAARGVLRWLESVQSRVRLPGPVSLLGFSQGGALALQLLRHEPETFACGVLLSAFAVPGVVEGDEALAQIEPPLFWGHDVADPVIPAEAVARLRSFASGHTSLTERRYPGAGHGITAAEAADVGAFLDEHARRT